MKRGTSVSFDLQTFKTVILVSALGIAGSCSETSKSSQTFDALGGGELLAPGMEHPNLDAEVGDTELGERKSDVDME